jgi:hypothetical protein
MKKNYEELTMVDGVKELKETEELKKLEDEYRSFMKDCIESEMRMYGKRLCFKKQYSTNNT